MGQFDVLTPRFMLDAVQEFPRDKSYIGRTLFPELSVSNYDLMWDQFVNQNTLANIYGIDAETIPGHDVISRRQFADLIRIQAARLIPEEKLLILRDGTLAEAMQTNRSVADLVGAARAYLARALDQCNNEVETTIEYLCINALQGSIPWPPPTITQEYAATASFSIDYNFNSLWNGKPISSLGGAAGGGGVPWSTVATADPVADLLALFGLMESNVGIYPGGATIILSNKVLSYLARNTMMRNFMQYTNPGFLNVTEIRSYFETQLGVTLQVYGAMYSDLVVNSAPNQEPAVNWKRFLPENRVIIIPNFSRGQIGNLITGPAWANNFQTGKYTWRKEQEDPWNVKVGVGYNGFPRIQHPEAIAVFDVDI